MTDAPSDRVRDEWRRRVEAEYRSAALTADLTSWLIRAGASPDLLTDGLAITGDELEHARLSHQVFLAAGGTATPDIDESTLGLRRSPAPLVDDLARAAVSVFCLGETIAVPLFSHLRAGCTEPVARAALDQIVRDEVRHRDFGWQLFGWLLELDAGERLRRLVVAELPAWFAELESAYGAGRSARLVAAGASPVDDRDRAWGLAPASEYAEILERAIGRDFAPRFAALEIDAEAAWARRACADSS